MMLNTPGPSICLCADLGFFRYIESAIPEEVVEERCEQDMIPFLDGLDNKSVFLQHLLPPFGTWLTARLRL